MDWEFIVDRIGLNHNEIVITDLVDWVVSPNHDEIVVADPLTEWLISPNHNEIVVSA